MMFRTHFVIGLLVGLLLLGFLKPVSPVVFMFGFVLASVLPDIDYPKSKVGRRVRPVSSLFHILFGHRGFLHTVYPSLLLFFVLLMFKQQILAVAVVFGYILHLLLDSMTVDGVKFFWPLWPAHFKWRLRTGGLMDIVIFFGGVVGLALQIKTMWF
jgi:inner membrane protein